jgi:hypothetical protein
MRFPSGTRVALRAQPDPIGLSRRIARGEQLPFQTAREWATSSASISAAQVVTMAVTVTGFMPGVAPDVMILEIRLNDSVAFGGPTSHLTYIALNTSTGACALYTAADFTGAINNAPALTTS